MAHTVFLHGVPDTPAMWGPLISELGLAEDGYSAPAMPGFSAPIPKGFTCTKEAYLDWFIAHLETLAEQYGPSNVVGHDWGAIITIRAASLRPDLFKTWTVANALPHPDYKWHQMARLWQTPVIGELMMMVTRKEALCKSLHAAGIPADLASHEASQWSADMRRAILKLYRSAKTAGEDWYPGTKNLPERGMIFWGEDDPYVPLTIAKKFAADTGARLERQAKTGHWSIVERADVLAKLLVEHWA